MSTNITKCKGGEGWKCLKSYRVCNKADGKLFLIPFLLPDNPQQESSSESLAKPLAYYGKYFEAED